MKSKFDEVMDTVKSGTLTSLAIDEVDFDLSHDKELVSPGEQHDGFSALVTLDRDRLAAASYQNHSIVIWSVGSAARVRTLTGHTKRVTALVRMSSDQLVSASEDDTIRVWDIKQGTCVKTLDAKSGGVRAIVKFTFKDSTRLASTGANNMIKIWNLDSGLFSSACVKTINFDSRNISALAALDNNILAVGIEDGPIELWDVKRGSRIQTFEHVAQQHVLQFCPIRSSQRLLIAAGDGGTLMVWDIRRASCIASLAGHKGAITCLADISRVVIASGSQDGTIRIWNIEEATKGNQAYRETLQWDASVPHCLTQIGRIGRGDFVSSGPQQPIRVWQTGSTPLNPEEGIRRLLYEARWKKSLRELDFGRHVLSLANFKELLLCLDKSKDLKTVRLTTTGLPIGALRELAQRMRARGGSLEVKQADEQESARKNLGSGTSAAGPAGTQFDEKAWLDEWRQGETASNIPLPELMERLELNAESVVRLPKIETIAIDSLPPTTIKTLRDPVE